MTEPYLGEIKMFAFPFNPIDYAFCDGQGLSKLQSPNLFSVLRYQFGGSGDTFKLPDMRRRVPFGAENDPAIGDKGGEEFVELGYFHMPVHTHTVFAVETDGDKASPTENYLAKSVGGNIYHAYDSSTLGILNRQSVSRAGHPVTEHTNMQPYQVINFCIALNGQLPPIFNE